MKEQLHEAQAAHQAGRHEEAERLYRMILSQDLNGDAAAGLERYFVAVDEVKAETHYRWALNNCEGVNLDRQRMQLVTKRDTSKTASHGYQ